MSDSTLCEGCVVHLEPQGIFPQPDRSSFTSVVRQVCCPYSKNIQKVNHTVRELCATVEEILGTKIEVKFGCTQTVTDIIMNQNWLFSTLETVEGLILYGDDGLERILRHEKYTRGYFLHLFVTKKKVKGGSEKATEVTPFLIKSRKCTRTWNRSRRKPWKNIASIKVKKPLLSGRQKVPVTEVAAFINPATNWNGKNKLNLGTKSSSKGTGITTPMRTVCSKCFCKVDEEFDISVGHVCQNACAE